MVALAALVLLSLPAFSEVKGTVVATNGKPIAKARVLIASYDPQKRSSPEYKTVFTDALGRFTSPSTSGMCAYTAVANGYCFASGSIQPQEQEVKITLYREGKLVGKVVDENGKPLAGAKVAIERYDAYTDNASQRVSYGSRPQIGIQLETNTAKDGSFVLFHIPRAEDFRSIWMSLTAVKQGRALVKRSVMQRDLGSGVKIVDPLECSLSGTVYAPNKTGTGPEGLSVALQMPFPDGRGSEYRYERLDKNGTFRFRQLPPGTVTVMVNPYSIRQDADGKFVTTPLDWVVMAAKDIVLSHSKPVTLELTGVTGAAVKATVIDSSTGKPVPEAMIQIWDASRPESIGHGNNRTDEKGEFSARVAPGEVKIAVFALKTSDGGYAGLPPDDMPSTTFTVADGESKTDVVINVDSTRPHAESMNYQAETKPVPADFELTAGTYGLVWDSQMPCEAARYTWAVYRDKEAITRLKKMPDLVTRNPWVQLFSFDGTGDSGLLAVALDESQGTGKGYDTAYIDVNRNGDLSDDKPIRWKPDRPDYYKLTDPVEVQSHQGSLNGEHTSNPATVRLQISKSGSNFYASLQYCGCWTGSVDSNKGKIAFASADTNNNGIYGDHMSIRDGSEPDYQTADWVFVDTNGLGQVVLYQGGRQAILLNDIVVLAGKMYRIRTNEIGNKVTIERYDGPSGTLTVRGDSIGGLKATANRIAVVGQSGMYEFRDCNGCPVTLPAGKYKLLYSELELDSKKLDKPKVMCQSSSETEVLAGQESTITLGGKLRPAIGSDSKDLVFTVGNTETFTFNINMSGSASIQSLGDLDRDQTLMVRLYDSKNKLVFTKKPGYT